MKKAIWIGAIAAAIPLALAGYSFAAEESVQVGVFESLDDYMAAFNARDTETWAGTLHYPHVRIASSRVRVWQNKQEYIDYMDFSRLTAIGWDHSQWDSREIVQSTKDKAHVAVQFSRFNKDNEKIATYESFYVLTLKDGHWGTQARSSFAP